MIGKGYWSTGITLRYAPHAGWAATVEYRDGGFCNDSADDKRVSTEGSLHTRYFVEDGERVKAIDVVVDVAKADAERLGVVWRDDPTVYMVGDGEWSDETYPAGWWRLANAQAERLGWTPIYNVERG
jgi:hypothetical protein